MRTNEEIKAKIKELEERIEWAEDPSNMYSDPWEEVPVLNAQINVLKWMLGKEKTI